MSKMKEHYIEICEDIENAANIVEKSFLELDNMGLCNYDLMDAHSKLIEALKAMNWET